ncbi:MAG: Gfo/Idh/MocA family protein [Planctomycetota bacterium]
MGTIGVGVIGLGFMGRTHIAAYESARGAGFDCELRAIASPHASVQASATSRGAGNLASGGSSTIDLARVRTYATADELLQDASVDLVSICTYTDTHVALARAALAAGKHVLIEKPVALRSAEIAELAATARAARTLCLPAMCLRFWPAWRWLRESIRSGAYGAVSSARFERLGAPPSWAQSFYLDARKSGNAIFDLHIHDVDFIAWCFGAPAAVCSTGSEAHVTTLYRFRKGPPHVVAEGGWARVENFKFRMKFTVVFEDAAADYEFGRDPELSLTRAGETQAIALDSHNGYDGEVRHLLAAIRDGQRALDATLEEAVLVTRVIEAERESLARGAWVAV